MRKSQLYSIAFGFSLLVLLLFSVLLYNSINLLQRNSSLVEHSQIIIDKLQELNLAMMDVEASQRGYLLTSDSSFLDLLMSSRNRIPLVLDTLAVVIKEDPDLAQYSNQLRPAIVQRLQKVQEVLNRLKYTPAALAIELKDGKKLMDEFRYRISAMQNQERALMKSRERSKQVYERLTPNYFKVIISITTITALISFVLLLRELRQRLAVQVLLETRVNTLGQANAELQQIAHVTSHDLQEPLRKIRMFIDALLSKFTTDLPGEARLMLERVDKNANYIRELVADLSDFANLANRDNEEFVSVDLNKILLDTQKDLGAAFTRKKAQLSISPLPRVNGFEKQLRILFKELFTNALKFSKDDQPLELTVTGNLANGKQLPHDVEFSERSFNVISVYDNGIGFEKEYSRKVFILFQKLHGNNSAYTGKGIGLAICQRIMANHDGFITATGDVGVGATFQLYFPID